MADVSKTVEIVFGTVNKSGQGVASFGKSLDGLAGSAQSVTGPLRSVSEGILKVEASAIAAGVVLAGLAINQSRKLAASVNEIGTLFNGTAAEIAAFKGDITAYANDSTQSLDNITSAVYTAVSAGVDYEKALGALTVAEQLSVAGKGDLESSLDVLTSSLNAYGESTAEAAEYADTLFTAVRLGKTTLPELSQGLAQVTGIAASTGVSFDELNAAIAALTATGLPTKQAITAIKAALANILKPAATAKEQAKELGLEFSVAALQAKGVGGFMDEVAQKTGGNAAQLANLFGSVEGLNSVLTLTGKASERFNNALDAMKGKSGAVNDAFKIMSENIDLVHTNLSNRLNTALATAGDQLIDQYGDLAASLGDLFSGFQISIDAGSLDGLFDILNQAQGQLAEWLSGVAEALPEALAGLDFSGLASAFDNLGGSIANLFNGLDLTKPEDLREVTQFAVDALTSLTNVTSGIVSGLGPYIDLLMRAVEATVELGPETEEVAGQILGFANGLDRVLSLVGGVGSGLVGIGDGLTYIAGAMVGKELLKNSKGLATNLGGLAGVATRLLPLLGKAGLAGVVAGLGVALGTLLEKTTGLGSALNDRLIPDAWFYEGATIGTVLFDLVEKLKSLNDLSPEVKKAFEEQAEWLRKERKELGYLNKETEEATEKTKGYTKEAEDLTKTQNGALEVTKELTAERKAATKALEGQGFVLNKSTGIWAKQEKQVKAATDALADYKAEVNKKDNSGSEFSESKKLFGEQKKKLFGDNDSDALKTAKTYRLIGEALNAVSSNSDDAAAKMEEAARAINKLGSEGETSEYTLKRMRESLITALDESAEGLEIDLTPRIKIADLGVVGTEEFSAKIKSVLDGAEMPEITPKIDPAAIDSIAAEIDSLNGREVLVKVVPDMSAVPNSLSVSAGSNGNAEIAAEQTGGRP